MPEHNKLFYISGLLTRRLMLSGAALALFSLPYAASAKAEIKDKVESISFIKCDTKAIPQPLQPYATCANIVVPENRELSDGRKLTLPIVRISVPAENKGGPVFYLSGGPGGSNTDEILPLAEMLARHDMYYVGYRGADGTTVMTCPEFRPALSAQKIFDDSALENIALAGKACAERLDASGIDLMRYTMFDVIEDFEAVRTAIAAPKINLISQSYGTRVAQYYARIHPDSIERSAMFGVNPPGHFVFSNYVNDKVLGRLTELCAASSDCAARTPNLGNTMKAALSAGARTGDPSLDDGRTQLALFTLLYSRAGTGMFIDAAIEAESGNLVPLAQGSAMIAGGFSSVIFGDLFSKGMTDVAHYASLEPTFRAQGNSMGSPLDLLYMSASKYWPKNPTPEKYLRAAYDPTPTLLVNGDIDVATPLLFVKAELVPYLPNAQLVVLKDYGHNDFTRQIEAMDHMVTRFYADGSVDTSKLKDDPYTFGK